MAKRGNSVQDTNFRASWVFVRGSATDYASAWNFEYDADGRLTKERLNGQVYGTETLYPLGERKVEFDKAGRRGPRGQLRVRRFRPCTA
jgi:hypothetical protein